MILDLHVNYASSKNAALPSWRLADFGCRLSGGGIINLLATERERRVLEVAGPSSCFGSCMEVCMVVRCMGGRSVGGHFNDFAFIWLTLHTDWFVELKMKSSK